MRRLSRAHALPAVGTLVNQPAYRLLQERYPRPLVVEAIRERLEAEREAGGGQGGSGGGDSPPLEGERLAAVEARLAGWTAPRLRRVINATGVILHTNLGRAPLSAAAVAAVQEAAAGYGNLELDLKTGRRGERAALVSELLCRLAGAEAGLAVNNNAAAVLLALAALARGREVVVSRGQLVEIGGSFRMPDVMRLSGARMVEVGTTNRTRAADYEEAVGPRTAALLRVHTSNFRVTGFTESASLEEMAAVARRHQLLLLDDLGSGALEAVQGGNGGGRDPRSGSPGRRDGGSPPLFDEPTVAESVRLADVVTFSGDKLLGGPQAGVVVGRAEPVARMAKHALARAVRVDKLSLAALEATLRQRLLGHAADVPVERMLLMAPKEIRRRAGFWLVKLADRGVPTRLLEGQSAVGGGSLPGHGLPTVLLALEGPASRLAAALREGEPPVVARVEADLCCLDPRTVLKGEDETLVDAVEAAYKTVVG
ncbi:MAG TPA: L-seryl-tRNA(Sec) selenium transferase [Candidatus Acidoferrales bacterium]|nr:L-seryl-tRNA(Sec) selenium transferase [Candidatus Acidoferrales bacterium]